MLVSGLKNTCQSCDLEGAVINITINREMKDILLCRGCSFQMVKLMYSFLTEDKKYEKILEDYQDSKKR